MFKLSGIGLTFLSIEKSIQHILYTVHDGHRSIKRSIVRAELGTKKSESKGQRQRIWKNGEVVEVEAYMSFFTSYARCKPANVSSVLAPCAVLASGLERNRKKRGQK